MKAVAVGFFDGVHLGHRKILAAAEAVLTFRNHPLSVVAPERVPSLIMTPEQRLAAIGLPTTMLDFTPALARLSPAEFVARHLSGCAVVCGENWRFGRGGEGNAAWLRARGIPVSVVPYSLYKGEVVSSTRIRAALESGLIAEANAMMSRNFQTRGIRVAGKGLGAKIGFPTVNMNLVDLSLKLPHGVYEVEVAGLRAVANFGLAPTMGDCAWPEPVLEAHFASADAAHAVESVGKELMVSFLRFVRPERKFDTIEDLQRQICADCGIIEA